MDMKVSKCSIQAQKENETDVSRMDDTPREYGDLQYLYLYSIMT